jgi:hypothetical protein
VYSHGLEDEESEEDGEQAIEATAVTATTRFSRNADHGLEDSDSEEDGEQAAIQAAAGASTTDDEVADEEVFPLGKASHHAESLAVVVGAKRADHASTSAECQRQADQVRGSGLACVYFHCGGSMVWLKGVSGLVGMHARVLSCFAAIEKGA